MDEAAKEARIARFGRTSTRDWLIAVGVPVVLAAIVFGAARSIYPKLPVIHDALEYNMTALRVLEDDTFARSHAPLGTRVRPDARFTPGYPVFLMAFYAVAQRSQGTTETIAEVAPRILDAQSLMSLLIVAFIAASGILLGGRRLGLLAGVLAAFYLPVGWSSSVMLSDGLGAVLAAAQLVLALWITAFEARRSPLTFALFGSVSAALTLVRPAMFLWMVLPLAFIAWRHYETPRRLVRLAAWVILGFALLMLPWWVRNAVTLHEVILLSHGAGNPMLISSGGDVLSPEEAKVARAAVEAGKDGEAAAARYRMRRQFQASPTHFLISRLQLTGGYIRVPWLTPWNPVEDAYWEESFHPDAWRVDLGPPPDGPLKAFALTDRLTSSYQWFLLVVALGSLAFVGRSPRLLLVLSVPVYTAFVHFMTLFLNRYFFAAMPAVIVLAACALWGAWRSLARILRGSVLSREQRLQGE